MNTKICYKCKKELPETDFYYIKTTNKYRSYCKKCCCTEVSNFYLKNKERINKKHNEYNKINKKEINNQHKIYYLNHKEEISINSHIRYLNNKETILNKHKVYRHINKKSLNIKKCKSNKIRRKNDINFKLICNLRARLCGFLKNKSKSIKTKTLLMCSVDELKNYLESKFQPGMTWDNYGKYGWHIDHIIPLTFFNLKDPTELYMACRHQNLQPMWCRDNWKKGKKLFNLVTYF